MTNSAFVKIKTTYYAYVMCYKHFQMHDFKHSGHPVRSVPLLSPFRGQNSCLENFSNLLKAIWCEKFERGHCSQATWVQILALPLTSYVALSKGLNFFVFQCPYL